MYTWLTSFYNNHIKRRLFPPSPAEERAADLHRTMINPADLHRTKINRAGQEVMDADAPLSTRVEAVMRLGILAYSGGYAGALDAAEFIPAVVDLLHIEELTNYQAIVIMQGLTNMCYCHIPNQRAAKDAGLNAILQERMTPAYPSSTKAKLWSCYLLNILCYSSMVIASPSLRESLEALEAEVWVSWTKNYARELLCMLGFWSPQPVTSCPPANGTRTQDQP